MNFFIATVFQYNGSAVLAIIGKECVAIGYDMRFGIQFQTIATDYNKIYQINEKVYVAFSGLGTDAQTLVNKFRFRHNIYKLREEKDMKPTSFAHLVSAMLYEKRFGPFFCEPIIAGLEFFNKPFICSIDSLGSIETSNNFTCIGSLSNALLGIAESVWKPDLEPDELLQVVARCLLSGVDRDAVAGWGVMVTLVTIDKVITRTFRGRMD